MTGPGFFIVFEGIDGSGKSTHIKLLSEELRGRGLHVLETSEPSRDKIGTFIRGYAERNGDRFTLETETLLFAANRYEHVKQAISPALKRGLIVISDRYFYSSIAYQGATGIDLDWIREMNRFASRPDLGILLADWGCDDPANGCEGDLNGDDKTDQADLGILLADWGCGT